MPVGAPLRRFIPKDIRRIPRDNLNFVHNGRRLKDVDPRVNGFTLETEYEELQIAVYPGVTTAILMGVGLLLSVGLSFAMKALAPPPNLENKQLYDNTEGSAVYGWDGIQNTTRNGQPIALPFGTHRVGGQILSAFTEAGHDRSKNTSDDPHVTGDGKNKLFALFGMGAGPICGINNWTQPADDVAVSADMHINGNAATSFDGVTASYRMGKWNQEVTPGFDDTSAQVSKSVTIYVSGYTDNTVTEVDAVVLLFRFPSGLYRVGDDGGLRPYECELEVKYRVYGSGAGWTTYSPDPVSAMTRTQYNWQHRIEFPADARYELSMKRITAEDGSYTQSRCDLVGINRIDFEDVCYQGITTTAVKALATEQLQGRMPTTTNLVHGLECRCYQPGDDFCSDSEQDFLSFNGGAGGKVLWGWHLDNPTKLTTADIHTSHPNKCYLLHPSDTSTWVGAPTAPFSFKEIYGDFDLQVRGAFYTGSASAGVGVALAIQDPDNATRHAHIGTYNDAGTLKWRCYNALPASPTDTKGARGASEWYYRVTRVGTTFTFYSSSNGTSWTQRDTYNYAQFTADHIKVGLTVYNDTSGVPGADFEDFQVNDETCYAVQHTSNNAWVVYYCLTDEDYALGEFVGYDSVDLDTFIDFAAYCKTLVDDGDSGQHRIHRLDGLIENTKGAWEQCLRIMDNARGTLLKQGKRVRATWDAAKSVTQMFGMANIRKDSYRQTDTTPKLGHNYWEVQFLNKDNEYKQDYAPYPDPEIEEGEPYRRKTTAKYGIVRPAEAYREALYLCRKNRRRTKAIRFATGADTIRCEPGDRIGVSHEVPDWGDSGRVVSATSTTVTLDEPVTLETGTNYTIAVRHSGTDEIETKTFSGTSQAGVRTFISVGSTWSTTPSENDLWAFGEQNVQYKTFLIANLKIKGSLDCEVEAVEYDATVYSTDVTTLPPVDYSQLPDPTKLPEEVQNVVLTERAQVMPDGTIVNVIDVTWMRGPDALTHDVYFREQGQQLWLHLGRTDGHYYQISEGVVYGVTYEVAVVANSWGARRAPSVSNTIAIAGKTEAPGTVTGLQMIQHGNIVFLTWDANSEDDLAGYEVRIGTGEWRNADWIGFVAAVKDVMPDFKTSNVPAGDMYFMVKAVNSSGIYSATAATTYETTLDRFDENILEERDEAAEGWDGTKTNMTVEGGVLTMDNGVTTASYQTPIVDLGAGSEGVRSLVTLLCLSSQIDRDVTWATATDTWAAITGTWAGDTESGELTKTVQIRFGNTTATWSGDTGYLNFINGEYIGRYFQVKVGLTTSSSSYGAMIEKMVLKVDPPDQMEKGVEVSISATGATNIAFSRYHTAPSFTAIPINGAVGDYLYITNPTSAGVDVMYYGSDNVQKAGTINWQARGY